MHKAQSMFSIKVYMKDGVRFRARFDRETKPGSAARADLEKENFLQYF